jgi:dipeptidyl aminopeptidase/acylaminoacyl peptidase
MRRLPLFLLISLPVLAEVKQFPGGKELPHEKYIHVVSEKVSPVQQVYIRTKDGLYVAAAMRKPEGNGPFPVLIHFHGAPGGRGMDQITGWSRGDHGGPVMEKFLQDGYVVVVGDYRGGQSFQKLADAVPSDAITYADDALAVVEHVRKLPYVDANRINVYGVSLGGDVVMHLLTRTTVHRAILGAPAPINFLGARDKPGTPPADRFKTATIDADRVKAAIAKIQTPILIQVGTADSLIHIDQILHDQLEHAGKKVRLEIYENGYHDFVMGPQGQPNRKEPLLDITLMALESSRQWVK